VFCHPVLDSTATNIFTILRQDHTLEFLASSIYGFEGNRPLGRPRHRWEDNFKMDLGNRVGGCGLNSSGPEQGPLAGCCEHGNEPFKFHKKRGIF
jgi:hypothetical protein